MLSTPLCISMYESSVILIGVGVSSVKADGLLVWQPPHLIPTHSHRDLSRARLPAQSLGAEAGSSFTFPSAPGRVSATPRSCVRPHPASRAFGVGAAPRGAAGHPRLQAPKRLLGVAPGKLTFRGHCPAWAPQWARGLWEDDCARGGRALRSWPQHLQGEGQRGNEGALLTNQSGTPGPSCCCFPTASKVGVVLQKALLKAF